MKKKTTSQDVAKLAGVSQSAVSSILNNNEKVSFSEETRARVLEAAHTLGYQLPKRKRVRQKKKAGMVLVLIPTLANQFYAELGRALESYADSCGVKVIVCSTFRKSELEQYFLELFLKMGVDGIIYTFLPGFPRMVERIDASVPVVLIGEKKDDFSVCSIEMSNAKSAYMLGEYLYSLGHRRFAFVSTPLRRITLAREQRLAGLRRFLEDKGLPADALEVIVPQDDADEDASELSLEPYEYTVGKSLTARALKKGLRATAVVAVNDMTAVGVADALKDAGFRVPEDYSVCGFDNIFSASITQPPLTTIDHQMAMRCRAAIDMIIARAGSENATTIAQASKIEYLPQLIERGSTGPAPVR